jgi:uncharacterized HAD superfamily protein
MSKVVAVDFDDVVFDCNTTLTQFHNARYGTQLTLDDITTWHLEEVWGTTVQEADRRIREYLETDFHHEAPLIAGAHDGLSELKNSGFKIMFVTSRSDRFLPQTKAWMDKNITGLYDELIFTNHFEAHARTKAEVCTEIGALCLIEDSIYHTENVAAAGIPVLLFHKLWNKSLHEDTNITRIHSWAEAVQKIMELAAAAVV